MADLSIRAVAVGSYPSAFFSVALSSKLIRSWVTQQNLGLKYGASALLKLGPLTSLGIILLVFAEQIP